MVFLRMSSKSSTFAADFKIQCAMKTKIFLLATLAAVVLAGCNSDVDLGKYENIPEVAEHVLGMTVPQAKEYLSKQGFYFGRVMENGSEYVFSRDKNLSEFSYEASSMFAFGVFSDTVRYASGIQRMETEKSAADLYWKWSHYTAQETWPKVYLWDGHITLKKESGSSGSRFTDYCEGTMIDQLKEKMAEQYNSGQITQEEYDAQMQSYSYDRKLFWSDLRQAGEDEKLDSSYEKYTTEDTSAHPKETILSVYMNNGGDIELDYETTHNFVWVWHTKEHL